MRKNKILIAVLLAAPFVLGMTGYLLAGEALTNAMYATMCLYVINPVLESYNIWIELARWLAPLATASGILMAFRGLWRRFFDYLKGLHKDASAVYCDEDDQTAAAVAASLKHGIAVTDGRLHRAPEQILLRANDKDNLRLYYDNQDFFRGKRVFMRLEEVDSFLLKESDIRFFSAGEITARQYWLQYPLSDYCKKTSGDGAKTDGIVLQARIAIVGFGKMGQRILNYGLLNNLYHLEQKIEYHIWGESFLYENSQAGFSMMNEDSIAYHGERWQDDLALLASMDRIIVTEPEPLVLLQELLGQCTKAEIYYYCSGQAFLESVFAADNLYSFGREEDILTAENIRTDQTYRLAKEINYQYALKYGEDRKAPESEAAREKEMEDEWRKLDGFTKGSNLAAADYHEIRLLMMKKYREWGIAPDTEELWELEHIRWCRYHFLNHWKYGAPENGRNKDRARRIHTLLVPYKELSKEDQEKDGENISLLQALKNN